MKKGDVLEQVAIEGMATEGKCVARVEGMVLFIDGGAPGDVADIQITKIKSNYLEGRLVQVRQWSAEREKPFCEHFGTCGGCVWQHLRYAAQLRYKQQQVTDNLERIGGLALPALSPIIPSAKTSYYRNRLDYSATSNRWLTRDEFLAKKASDAAPEIGLGFHMPRSFDKVFDVRQCHLQPDPSNAVRQAVKKIALAHGIPFFDLRAQTGYVRTLTLRTTTTQQVMVILQVAFDQPEWLNVLLTGLQEQFPTITSFNYVINTKRNDTFNDLPVITWKGTPYIIERMAKPDGNGHLDFRIGPKSFYQTNAEQAEVLYRHAWMLAGLTGKEVVYDLYTGTGTIANYVAPFAKTVIGLEYVPDAIEDAKVNSQINGITNTHFFAGDMKDLLNDAFLQHHGKPDVVITDPPRAGMHENVCAMLLNAAPTRIVYVSCNPATQARDLKLLAPHYNVTAVQPVDMFPHTMHVENIALLERK